MNIYEEKIKEFLGEELQIKVPDSQTNLIAHGLLDSFSMIKLIDFIDQRLSIKVDMEKIDSNNFNSIESIAKTIQQWR